jgi:AcrR family transcriptional regulator
MVFMRPLNLPDNSCMSATVIDAPVKKTSFRQHMQQAREEAIVRVVNRLLAEKGFDAMTVDEVAAEVGIAKASLYRHFPSKEDLAAAAMVKAMQQAMDFIDTLHTVVCPLARLQAVARWTMKVQLAGEMPSLPSENSSLRATLTSHTAYVDLLLRISETLGGWIEAAQDEQKLAKQLPPIVVLYTLYARACDPVLGFLKATGQFTDEQIIDWVMQTCFEGLRTR